MDRPFEELVAEANAVPIEGWDFSWLKGRATEERPTWHYSELVTDRISSAQAMVDLQCGGGETLSRLPGFPALTVAAEDWEPNLVRAAERLGPRGIKVVNADTEKPFFPFADAQFDLVTSRHPVVPAGRRSLGYCDQVGGSSPNRLVRTRSAN